MLFSESKKTLFNQFASLPQPNFPVNQTAVIFPVESIDNQPELIHQLTSIGELNQLSSSKFITLPGMPTNQPASATVRPKKSLLFP